MKRYLHINFNNYSPLEIKDLSFVLGYMDDHNEKDLSEFITVHKNISIGQNEKFYFLPGVTIPRIKLKDLYASTKSKTVRDISDATKIITGIKTINALSDRKWYHYAKTEIVKDLIEQRSADIGESRYKEIMEILNNYTEDIVIGGSDLSNILKYYHYNAKDYSRYSVGFTYINKDYEDLYEHIAKNDIYDEASLISIVNGEDSTTIDEAMYQTLTEMFTSSDKDNWTLAMEIMANCNYNESLLYLSFLFEKYSNRISDQKTRNHVNFKSLCSYMGFSSPTYCSMRIDDVIKILLDKDVFTKEAGRRILEEYKSDIEYSGSTKLLKVVKITFDESVMEYLKQKEAKNEPEHIE